MIRSCRIPQILSRICDDSVIESAMLVTSDGELLGTTSTTFVNPEGQRESMEHLGTLIADIAVDYQRLGEEYGTIDSTTTLSKKSHLQCLLLEMEQGLIGVSGCVGIDCFVIGLAGPSAPPGMIKAKLQALAEHVQEALSPLTETSYR